MKKLVALLVLGFLMVGASAMAQEHELQIWVFSMAEDTAQIGGTAFLRCVIGNPDPVNHLSGIGYMTIDTPWGATITRGPWVINRVAPITSRRKNFTIPVSQYARPGIYNLTGWITMEGETVALATESIEVVP